MKKWFDKKNAKKKRLVLVACLALLCTAGTTYAWWTASVETAQSVTMGKLSISGNLAKPSSLTNWEPGLVIDTTGKIKNNGSIDTLIKISPANKIQKTTDSEFVDAGDMLDLTVGPAGSDVYTDITQEDGKVAYWYSDSNKNVYLLLSPGMSVDLAADTELVGEKMGNETMGAKVKVAVDYTATQVLDGATQSLFGTGMEDFTALDGVSVKDGVKTTPRIARSAQSAAPAKSIQYLKELMNRNQ